ncbi:hypothetical protein [Citrobacter braakii]|uniref:hypothetical protein n=1 Tax=Citrobacter braakii TaxID=57706 RepID=UPI0034E4FD3E
MRQQLPGGVWPDDLARWRGGEPKVAGFIAFIVSKTRLKTSKKVQFLHVFTIKNGQF